jgi:3-oxoacyl-[acyl-carrier-protein] synthase-1
MTAAMGLPYLGIAAPVGIGKAAVASAVFAGSRHGIVLRDDLVPSRHLRVGAVAAELPAVAPQLARFDSRNNRLMLAALEEIAEPIQAMIRRQGRDRIAVVLGTSTSGLAEAEAAYAARRGQGFWPAQFHYQQMEAGSLAKFVALALQLTGPAYTIATACAASAKALASGRRLIRAGLADAAIVGGCDTLCRITAGGFSALEAMAQGFCNPFSANRDGINIGEAAAVFLMTPEPAEVQLLGVGESSDAHHVSAPDPGGRGATLAMRMALDEAELRAEHIDYINLHGTGTQQNDLMEGRAVHALFGGTTACSSTKAITGHTLGAAGACEAAFLWLTLSRAWNRECRLPPHVWDGVADPTIPPLALVRPGGSFARKDGGEAMLSNSFAFGGSNVALVLGRNEVTRT